MFPYQELTPAWKHHNPHSIRHNHILCENNKYIKAFACTHNSITIKKPIVLLPQLVVPHVVYERPRLATFPIAAVLIVQRHESSDESEVKEWPENPPHAPPCGQSRGRVERRGLGCQMPMIAISKGDSKAPRHAQHGCRDEDRGVDAVSGSFYECLHALISVCFVIRMTIHTHNRYNRKR